MVAFALSSNRREPATPHSASPIKDGKLPSGGESPNTVTELRRAKWAGAPTEAEDDELLGRDPDPSFRRSTDRERPLSRPAWIHGFTEAQYRFLFSPTAEVQSVASLSHGTGPLSPPPPRWGRCRGAEGAARRQNSHAETGCSYGSPGTPPLRPSNSSIASPPLAPESTDSQATECHPQPCLPGSGAGPLGSPPASEPGGSSASPRRAVGGTGEGDYSRGDRHPQRPFFILPHRRGGGDARRAEGASRREKRPDGDGL